MLSVGVSPDANNQKGCLSVSWIARAMVACLAASAFPSKAQETSPSFWSAALSAINDTTPAGLKPRAERASGWGWFADQWESGKALAAGGQMNLFLPAYTHHPPAQFDNYQQQNAYPFGGGIASYLVDAKDNERMLYALAFSDSHYNIQPLVGYAWVARWPVLRDIKAGIGYTAFITARNDAMWLPFPAVLPLLSLGTDAASLYAVYIPTQNVTFAFLRLSGNAIDLGPTPGTTDGGDRRRNLLYAGYGYVNADPAEEIPGMAGTNGGGPVIGYRRFLTERFAAELSFERSGHDLSFPQQPLGSFRRNAYTLAAQYHFPVAQRVQLYGGLGVAYERVSQQQFADASLESSSIGPVIQAGFSLDLTSLWTLTGGIRTGFPRHELTVSGAPAGTVLLAPVTFSLGLGARF
jgi:opacity protein-like surface antigen